MGMIQHNTMEVSSDYSISSCKGPEGLPTIWQWWWLWIITFFMSKLWFVPCSKFKSNFAKIESDLRSGNVVKRLSCNLDMSKNYYPHCQRLCRYKFSLWLASHARYCNIFVVVRQKGNLLEDVSQLYVIVSGASSSIDEESSYQPNSPGYCQSCSSTYQQNSGAPIASTSYGHSSSVPRNSKKKSKKSSNVPVVYTDGGCFANGRRKASAGIGVYWGDGDKR